MHRKRESFSQSCVNIAHCSAPSVTLLLDTKIVPHMKDKSISQSNFEFGLVRQLAMQSRYSVSIHEIFCSHKFSYMMPFVPHIGESFAIESISS